MPDQVPQHLVDRLAEHDQSHLCRWWNDLADSERAHLVHQLEQIDFALIDRLVAKHLSSTETKADDRASKAGPPRLLERLPEDQSPGSPWGNATRAGEDLLRTGKVAAMVVAGGQGSRLGFDKPKGMFPIGPVSDASLFQIHFEQLEALQTKYGVSIPYFIMTSEATDAATKEYLEANEYFGYSLHDVYIFKQGWLPAVDADGKILLADKGEIATSPDGHGGMLKALQRSGLIEIMCDRGIEHVYYHQVDNPTAILCDPTLLGLHLKHQSELTTKVVAKTGPAEKMGVVVDVEGVTQIIEYSDLTEEQQAATDADGGLRLWAGNMAIHVFSRGLLERLTGGEAGLPYHRAHKKIAHLSGKGDIVTPASPNGYKFEQFIFDALPEANNALVVEADRAREFNPVKNADGTDSPATARQALLDIARQWAVEAGAVVADDARVEISPLFALTAEDAAEQISTGQRFSGDVYLQPEPHEA